MVALVTADTLATGCPDKAEKARRQGSFGSDVLGLSTLVVKKVWRDRSCFFCFGMLKGRPGKLQDVFLAFFCPLCPSISCVVVYSF